MYHQETTKYAKEIPDKPHDLVVLRDQLLFLRVISVLTKNDASRYGKQERTTSFEVKLTWVKIPALPLSNWVSYEPNYPHPPNEENGNIKEGEMDREAGEDDEGSCVSLEISFWNNMAFVLKTILSFGQKDQRGSTLNFTRKSISSVVIS